MTAPLDDETAELQRVNTALRQQLDEQRAERDAALAREVALAEVLDLINRSPGNPRPIFDAILEKAHRLCGATVGNLVIYDSESFRVVASHGFPEHVAEMFRQPRPASSHAQPLLRGERLVHIADVRTLDTSPDDRVVRALRDSTDVRSFLLTPLRKDGILLGFISAHREEVRPFSDNEIALLESFAAQAVIAIENARLLGELQRRTDELATRNSEFRERIEQQAATIDVLKAMSASPGNPQPVFDLIVHRASELCNAPTTALMQFDGEFVHLRSVAYSERSFDREGFEAYKRLFPMVPTRGSLTCRAILDRQIIHVRDLPSEAGLMPAVRQLGHRSQLSLPLIRDVAAIGAISLGAMEPGGFTDSQVALLQTFAEQAVIAITSADTYRALQTRTAALAQRNTEFGERIEQQSATIDVLKAMSDSPGDTQPVFELITRHARELCGSLASMLFEFDGEQLHLRAWGGWNAAAAEGYLRKFPMRPDRDTANGRAILERQVVHIRDVDKDPELSPTVPAMGVRSTVAVPLLRDGLAIGTIAIGSSTTGGFSDTQIALLRTFAEQAVIAITSAETYRALQTRTADLQQSLEYQTATSDVLRVISRSSFDLEPVFQAVVETATRLCHADQAAIYRHRDGAYRWAASFSNTPEYDRIEREVVIHPGPGSLVGRVARDGRTVQILDAWADPLYEAKDDARVGGVRTLLGVPLLREGVVIGVIGLARRRIEPYTEAQTQLVSTFADQAVIAIENTRLLTEQQEALEQQTATAEVLQVINSSPGDLTPVFDAILDKAHSLCGADKGALTIYDGERYYTVATRGLSEAYTALLREPRRHTPGSPPQRLFNGESFVHIQDFQTDEHPLARAVVEFEGARTILFIPLRKDSDFLGFITAYRQEARPFSDKQITLLQNFAAQAVIAMENARLITEQREALEQQTATAEVLQVINSNPGDLAPVFEALLQKALHLCEAAFGSLFRYDDPYLHLTAYRPAEATIFAQPWVPEPESAMGQVVQGADLVHVADVADTDAYRSGIPSRVLLVERMGAHTVLWVALRKDEALLGVFVIYRGEVRPFTDKQIALLKNFAAQAVIAMENARLLGEIRQRQEELRITFENMGDGVALFDETPRLVAWNSKFQKILDVPDGILAERKTYEDYIRYLTERGEFGPNAEPEAQIHRLQARVAQSTVNERARPNGRVIEVRHNPVPGGGFVLIYTDITERKRNEAELRTARDSAEEASRAIEAAYRDLKAAQANLIQAEKMASLGQLTAGIAHEIKNPLNFVNNFASLSVELLAELKETAAPGFATLPEDRRADVEDVSGLLTSNLQKIVEHGKRADGIVKSMLEHSRGASGERRMVDLNTLVDEALNLAYHGARAQDQSFNVTLERDFGAGIAPIELAPQEMTRVFLNLFSNGFYATRKRAQSMGNVAGFGSTLRVATRDLGEAVEVRIHDNGTGIPAEVKDKLFQPFFTTKPTGEGTGLGLSISYDIVTQQHGGTIVVESEPGVSTEFIITLPRLPAAVGERVLA